MAGWTGIEPATSDVTGRRSNQTELPPLLNNGQSTEFGVIKRSSCESIALYSELRILVGGTGIEPVTPAL